VVELVDEGKEGEGRRSSVGGGVRVERRERKSRAGRGRGDEPGGDEESGWEKKESVKLLESH